MFPQASLLNMKTPLDLSASNFLIEASLLYKDTCPELSRHLMQDPVQDMGTSRKLSLSVCGFCYQWLQPGNHTVRVRPKQRPSARVQRVLQRQAQGKPLSLVQKDMLQQFHKTSSALMATCHTCNRTSRHKGMGREFIMTLSRTPSTPGSSGKHKTPQTRRRSSTTTPKTGGKDKTPVNTPRASISSTTPGSGSTSSKSPAMKGKNWVVQRLSKILSQEETPGKKKGGLKDFLSSLGS